LIDLHTHTTASDGSDRPTELIRRAVSAGLKALAITDHDTFEGYWEAREAASAEGLELICGIELETRLSSVHAPQSIHLLAYFVDCAPTTAFIAWVESWQQARRKRNELLASRLRELGLDIDLKEVEALGGRLTGRPHFARLLVQKGYAGSYQEAFARYLDERAPAYVPRQRPELLDAIKQVVAAGGIPVLAHPARLGWPPDLEEGRIGWLAAEGLRGLEAWHSDHGPSQVRRYLGLAQRYGLVPTGGSDYHGAHTPSVRLGYAGDGTPIPDSVLVRLRALVGS